MWFLIVLVVVWAAVVVLVAAWGVVCWRERRQQRIGRRPAHRPVWGPQLRSAVSVEEIQRRLAAEATRPRPPARKITVLPRAARPVAGPDTEPFDLFGQPDDEAVGGPKDEC